MFAVNDVTFYDVMCIPRGQADGTLFTRPFLPLWVGGAGVRDYSGPVLGLMVMACRLLLKYSIGDTHCWTLSW